MLKEFKEFIAKGNLVEIAVGLILALAFAGLVTSFTENLINPIIGAIFGKPNFDSLVIGIGDAELRYGAFLTTLLNFLYRGVRAVPDHQGLQPGIPEEGRGRRPDRDRAPHADQG
jgi:large conductance mechanosensitive channel protein